MAQLYFRIFFRQVFHNFTPQHGNFQYVGFIYRAQTLITGHRRFKCYTADTTDLILVVNVGVITFTDTTLFLTDAPWLTKVDTTGQFTNDQDIQPGNNLFLQG